MSRTTKHGDSAAADRWALVQDVLGEAIDCPAEQRRALVDARCGADADLRREVESLLLAHEQEGVVDRLTPLVTPASALLREPVADWSGRTVAEYLVQKAIGAGGMGVVYKARDERLGRHVALKFLPPALGVDPGAKARFIAEARAAAALDHPNVCTIYGIGETGDGQLFIAMPLYEGETLQERIARGRLTFDEALPIALQVARGLKHAHDAGIVHLDVKPSNIVVLPDGAAKVLDFGIAQIHHAPLVDPRTMMGTVPYMSPEQAAGRAVDRRSDIWSLAVVLHEMLAGRRPFDGNDATAVLQAILRADPVLTATSHPDVPASLERVLSTALAKLPGDRHASMSLFASELSAAARERAGGRAVEIDDPQRMSATERRRAAVLVTLVSDYPGLVDRVAHADAQRAIARVREVAVDVAREYGGLVNQAIGDEIVSLFGVPSAHEDDELRALRAALDLHARVEAIDPRELPAALRLRVQSGLHVGPVVARRLHEGPRRYDIVGAPLAQACRLAVLADPGDVWVSPEMQRLVGPYMHTSACAAVVLDSQAELVTPFRVLGETGIATRLEASKRTGLTPYVGRQSELSTLQARVARAAADAGSVVAVVGEPGAGKSRLLYELQESLRTEAGLRLVQARCRAYGDGVPYGVFVQILCAGLDLHPPLTGSDVVARVRALDRSLERFLPLYLHLLSVQSHVHVLPKHLRGEHLQAALLDALAAAVGALTRLGPLLVVVEDWHWSDTGSRTAFARVADLAAALPLTLIVTSRADQGAADRWPASTTFVRLERLDFAASTSIVETALGVRKVSGALARRLYDRAGGNPLFLEQMCAALLEQRAVTIRDGVAVVEDEENRLALPETVQGVIRARLDILDARVLEVARVAAVIGREFDYALLAEVAPADVDLRSAIAAAEAAGLVRRTSVAPLAYRFTHALAQEVCYESLVAHQRKMLHGAIGRALAATHATDELASLVARHFARAEEWPAAVLYGRRAAERAIALSQFGDALATLDDVVEWIGRVPDRCSEVVADLLLQQERVCETLGLRARQQQIIDRLIAHLARDGGSVRLAEVYLRQGDLSTLLKRFDAADRALTTALRIGQEREDTTLVRSGLRSLGLLRWHEGRHAEVVEIARRALALDRESGDDVAVAVDLTSLGNILKATGDHRGARTRLEEALAMPALRTDPKKLVYTQHNLAKVYRETGDLDRALACLAESDEIARVHLLPIQRSFHLTSMAHIQLQQGRIDEALDTYRAAVDLSRQAQHAEGLVQSLRMLGNTLLALARYEEALPCLQEAAQLFVQLEDRGSEAEMRTGIALILERTSLDEAAQAWSVVLDLQRSRGDSRGELRAREGLARATRERGGDAVSAFESALALAVTIGHRARETAIRNTLGILEWERGGYAAALKHYECALALAREEGSVAHEVVILNSLGASLTRLGRPDEARTVLEESLALGQTIGERQLKAHALAALGHVSLTTGDPGSAAQRFEESRLLRQAIGDRAGAEAMERRLASLAREP